MMDSIALASMSMAQAQVTQGLSLAMTKETMDSQEVIANNLIEMMNDIPKLGKYIDTYA